MCRSEHPTLDFHSKKIMYITFPPDLMANISMNRYQFPSQEDVDGVIAALLRLQDTYSLEPRTMASGNLGSTKGLSMSSMFIILSVNLFNNSICLL